MFLHKLDDMLLDLDRIVAVTDISGPKPGRAEYLVFVDGITQPVIVYCEDPDKAAAFEEQYDTLLELWRGRAAEIEDRSVRTAYGTAPL